MRGEDCDTDQGSDSRPLRLSVVLVAVLGLSVTAIGAVTVAEAGEITAAATGPGENLSERHVETITDAGSATTTLSLSRESDSKTISIERNAQINFTQSALVEDSTVSVSYFGGWITAEPLQIQQYETPAGIYTRVSSSLVSGNHTQYDQENGSWAGEDAEAQLFSTVLEDTEQLSWSNQGTEQYNGTTVTRYTVDGVEDVAQSELNLTLSANASASDDSESLSLTLSNVTVTDATGTLLIDSKGVVRKLSYTLDVTEDSESVTYVAKLAFSDVGSTAAQQPGWTETVDTGQNTP